MIPIMPSAKSWFRSFGQSEINPKAANFAEVFGHEGPGGNVKRRVYGRQSYTPKITDKQLRRRWNLALSTKTQAIDAMSAKAAQTAASKFWPTAKNVMTTIGKPFRGTGSWWRKAGANFPKISSVMRGVGSAAFMGGIFAAGVVMPAIYGMTRALGDVADEYRRDTRLPIPPSFEHGIGFRSFGHTRRSGMQANYGSTDGLTQALSATRHRR